MNIIICGLKGSGKTTLAKIIAEKYDMEYIDDYGISEEDNNKNVKDFVQEHDNVVFDLCYSIMPSQCAQLSGTISIFLGFVSIDENTLYKLMKSKMNVSMTQVSSYKKKSAFFCQECENYKLPFFDVNRDRQEIIDEILAMIDEKII